MPSIRAPSSSTFTCRADADCGSGRRGFLRRPRRAEAPGVATRYSATRCGCGRENVAPVGEAIQRDIFAARSAGLAGAARSVAEQRFAVGRLSIALAAIRSSAAAAFPPVAGSRRLSAASHLAIIPAYSSGNPRRPSQFARNCHQQSLMLRQRKRRQIVGIVDGNRRPRCKDGTRAGGDSRDPAIPVAIDRADRYLLGRLLRLDRVSSASPVFVSNSARSAGICGTSGKLSADCRGSAGVVACRPGSRLLSRTA